MNAGPQITSHRDIPGWFPSIDEAIFEHFLSADAVAPRGDLVELGVYLGKSAAFIGRFKRPEETFTVCDLFGLPPEAGTPRRRSFSGLRREEFERNYLALFDELPVVVQGPSSTILDHVAPGTVRFLHVDASHQYAHVAVDVESARKILLPDGVVVFDDYRTAHTPGVAAAVWEAVLTKGLRPICITPQKLYGTFGDPEPHRQRVAAWLTETERFPWETLEVAGAPLIRMWQKSKPAAGVPTVGSRRPLGRRLARRLTKVLSRGR